VSGDVTSIQASDAGSNAMRFYRVIKTV
jgi:hypothetical protein